MFCDRCDRGYHTFCVGLKAIPKGHWDCQSCKVPADAKAGSKAASKATPKSASKATPNKDIKSSGRLTPKSVTPKQSATPKSRYVLGFVSGLYRAAVCGHVTFVVVQTRSLSHLWA
jgi:hypothetical protein